MTLTDWAPLPESPPFDPESVTWHPDVIMELSGVREAPKAPHVARQFHDHRRLTGADEIAKRIGDLTARGPWSGSDQAKLAYGLLLGIRSVILANLAGDGRSTLTRAQLRQLLADGQFGSPAEQNAALGALLQDEIIARTQDGGVVILAPPSGQDSDPWPGWEGPDPKTVKLPHMPVDWQLAELRGIYAGVLEHGLPDDLRLPAEQWRHFGRARRRGRVALCAWAWAWLFNQQIPHERHPLSPRTAARRLADLEKAGELVKVRRAVMRFDASAWNFRTRAAEFAYPAPGLAGVVSKVRRSVRARLAGPESDLPAVTPAWRLQQARWELRDAERVSAIWEEAW